MIPGEEQERSAGTEIADFTRPVLRASWDPETGLICLNVELLTPEEVKAMARWVEEHDLR